MARTPGPWRVSDKVYFDGRDDYLVVTSAARWVCNVMVNDQAEEDARLIAAAPDLLAELKSLRLAYVNLLEIGRDRILGLGGTCDPVDVMEAGDPALKSASAAIARAEGRS
jgi:hypothetical protein